MAVNSLLHPDSLFAKYAAGKRSSIICLTHNDLTRVDHHHLERITYGADVCELRVDLLDPHGPSVATSVPSAEYVIAQIDHLRKTSSLPILFTIRSVSQGGKFLDNAEEEARRLMLIAVEKGCEYIDVEITWPDNLISEVVRQKKNARIIASYHDWSGKVLWSGSALKEAYDRAIQYGDIVKLSVSITEISDNHELAIFVREHRKNSPKPIIAVGMGVDGQLSRVLSNISMVTHPLLPTPAAPGQMSVAQINRTLHLIGQIPAKRFYIFGHNISHSLSPMIHNTAFQELGLPHHYSIHQTPQIDGPVERILQDPSFGGASVTYPHKLEIPPLLRSLSQSAVSIGAVNTVVVRQSSDDPGQRTLHGDNSDWSGIRNCIQKSRVQLKSSGAAIVIGAGGAARAAVYALQQLGVSHVIIVNRTTERAQKLASNFPSLKISLFQSVHEVQSPVNCIIACVPADDITEDDIPLNIFASGVPGVIIEMAYRPPVTSLMKVGQRLGPWSIFGGVDVLRQQAYTQFELWTEQRAPVLAIEDALSAHSSKI